MESIKECKEMIVKVYQYLKKNMIKITNSLNVKHESMNSGIKEESRKNERTIGVQEKSDYGLW